MLCDVCKNLLKADFQLDAAEVEFHFRARQVKERLQTCSFCAMLWDWLPSSGEDRDEQYDNRKSHFILRMGGPERTGYQDLITFWLSLHPHPEITGAYVLRMQMKFSQSRPLAPGFQTERRFAVIPSSRQFEI